MPADVPDVQAGDLDHTISILQGIQAGSPAVQTWSSSASVFATGVRADIQPQRGSETAGGNLTPPNVQTFEIITRFLPGVRPKMRITWVDAAQGNLLRTFEIDDVVDVGMRRRKLSMMCREVRA